jgi:hypothetical protein
MYPSFLVVAPKTLASSRPTEGFSAITIFMNGLIFSSPKMIKILATD